MCCCPTVYPPPAQAKPAERQAAPVTAADVQTVHAAIESCLQKQMTQLETVQLLARFGVQPKFTLLVWERLEAENAEWFASYYRQLETTAELERCHL